MHLKILAVLFLLFGAAFSPVAVEEDPYNISLPEIDLSPYQHCPEYDFKDTLWTNGFIDQWGFCIPGYVSTESWFLKQPDLIYGRAVFYAPGIMKSTAKWRGMDYPEGYIGGVALGSPAEIGETVWLYGPFGWEGPFLVVDCPQRVDVFTTIVLRQQAVEVDFNTAMRWGMVEWADPLNSQQGWTVKEWSLDSVLVYKGYLLPQDIMHREPVYFAGWWQERMEFSEKEQPKPIMERNGIRPLWKMYGGRDEPLVCYSCPEPFVDSNHEKLKHSDLLYGQSWQRSD